MSCLFAQGLQNQVDREVHGHPIFFLQQKEKKEIKVKKEKVSRQKLLKGCHQGQIITVLAVLERLEFKDFSCRPTMVAYSVPWPIHFKIHFAGPAAESIKIHWKISFYNGCT